MMKAADPQSETTQTEAARTLRNAPTQDQERAVRERIARVHAIRGKYTHIPTSSDAFARKKQEEIVWEGRRS